MDRGFPPLSRTVEVQIDVVDRANNPPVWDQTVYGPIFVKENRNVGDRVVSVKASSGIENNPTVFYRLIRGSTAQTNKYDTFYLQQRNDNGHTWADIKVNHPLDYESIKEYNLTIRVENNGVQQLGSEATIYIVLEDVNDEIPLFTEREQETVLEGEPIGTPVTRVNAIDKDGTFPNNQVFYGIVRSPRNEGRDYFEINEQTGEIFTKVVFDREKQGAYALEVEARDGAPSARPNSNGQPNSGNHDIFNKKKILIGPYPEVAHYDSKLRNLTKPASLRSERLSEELREQRLLSADISSRLPYFESVNSSASELISNPENTRIARKIDTRLKD
ncbi:hypothetical protein QYM36_001313 [Artemia franciscana]|uniref:Cadherin domain-containing protein n=2 Tax=Artemia franciscana TaxID=6661 RepID=A0AA88LFH1_ARTSF|nr:hypothetical protein QYM36_001313 [Artemia franciscana]KAK2724785.1 hypothetical protein QYM36_001313 [Artemia franciscana]